MEWIKGLGGTIRRIWDKLLLTLKSRSFIEEKVLEGIDIDIDGLYEDPSIAVNLQQRYLHAIKQVDMLKPKYKEVVNHITLVQRIEMLSTRAKQELEKLCQIYSETLVKKGEFKEKIKDQSKDRSSYLQQYEDSMASIIEMMKGHEDNQRMVKQDLAYLESEKSELLYQSRRLKSAYSFIKSTFIVVALLTAVVAFVLSVMYFAYSVAILTWAMISMIAVIGATVWIYVFRRYLVYEITKKSKN